MSVWTRRAPASLQLDGDVTVALRPLFVAFLKDYQEKHKTGLLDSAMFDPSKTCLFIFLLLNLSNYYLIQYYAQRINVLRYENSGVLFRHGNVSFGESHFANL
jgi:hypothetical protein